MKKTVILLILIIALMLIPYQVLAKKRVFITFSDFVNNQKYTLYETKISNPEQPKPVEKVQTQNPIQNTPRNIFSKTAKSY